MRTPLKAIRRYCVEDCCCGSRREVRYCTSTDCALYPYRFGRKPRPDDYHFRPGLSASEAETIYKQRHKARKGEETDR